MNILLTKIVEELRNMGHKTLSKRYLYARLYNGSKPSIFTPTELGFIHQAAQAVKQREVKARFDFTI